MSTTIHIWGNTCINSGFGTRGRGVFFFNGNTSWFDIRGNIAYQANGQPYLSPGSTVPPAKDPTKYSNNLWFGAGAPPAWDTNPVNADPLFVGAPNYRLQAGSPARMAGSTLNYVTIDLDGTVRPTTVPWSIGAYESVPTVAGAR